MQPVVTVLDNIFIGHFHPHRKFSSISSTTKLYDINNLYQGFRESPKWAGIILETVVGEEGLAEPPWMKAKLGTIISSSSHGKNRGENLAKKAATGVDGAWCIPVHGECRMQKWRDEHKSLGWRNERILVQKRIMKFGQRQHKDFSTWHNKVGAAMTAMNTRHLLFNAPCVSHSVSRDSYKLLNVNY